jgi:hypothetical protein
MTAVDPELRRHMDLVAESLRAEIRAIAEGFTRIDRFENALREEILRSHDELASLIRLTLIDLDGRIRVLERRAADSD